MKGHVKLLLDEDVFLSVSSVNGKGKDQSRRIPSLVYLHQTIHIPDAYSVTLTYNLFTELVDKSPLSISKATKENGFSNNRRNESYPETVLYINYVSQQKSKWQKR